MKCVVCDNELTGNQRKYCSKRCKKIAGHRMARGQQLDVIPKRSHTFFKDNIQNRINTKSSKIIYIGGYTDDKSNIYLQCSDCGNFFARSTRVLRPSGKKTIQCDYCNSLINNNIPKIKYIRNFNKNKYEHGITLKKLAERDNDVCWLCGGKVEWTDYEYRGSTRKAVGKSYPSIDHVKPVSRGGSHSWDNVRLAHFGCNASKGNRMFGVETNGQTILYC